MRRRDDPHIGAQGRMPPDPIKVAIRQHGAQESSLQFRRHVANFIEKQRAAFGLFKTTTAHRLRPVNAPRS